jgi:uncharacterized small protein (DUF1192 family)
MVNNKAIITDVQIATLAQSVDELSRRITLLTATIEALKLELQKTRK